MDNALQRQGLKANSVERWKKEMPTEAEMLPKDKYTIFDRKEKRYRKGIHSEFSALLCKSNVWRLIDGNRVAEVDEGQPEIESAWLLISTDDTKLFASYHEITLALHGVWSVFWSFRGFLYAEANKAICLAQAFPSPILATTVQNHDVCLI